MASEREQLPEHFTTKPVKWTALSEANQKAYKDQEDEVIFKILSKFGLNMLNLALSLEDTSRILRRFSILAELEGRTSWLSHITSSLLRLLTVMTECSGITARVDALMGVLDSIHRAISMTTSGASVTVPIQKERMVSTRRSVSQSISQSVDQSVIHCLHWQLYSCWITLAIQLVQLMRVSEESPRSSTTS